MCAHCKCVCISGGVAFVCVILKKVGQSGWTRAPLCPPIISKLTCCWNPCGLLKQNNMNFAIVVNIWILSHCTKGYNAKWINVMTDRLFIWNYIAFPWRYFSSTLSWRSVCVWAGIPCVRVFFSIILALCSIGIVQRKAKINFILRAYSLGKWPGLVAYVCWIRLTISKTFFRQHLRELLFPIETTIYIFLPIR